MHNFIRYAETPIITLSADGNSSAKTLKRQFGVLDGALWFVYNLKRDKNL